MAGINVIQSYEWWGPAAETLKNNLGGEVSIVDIRALPLESIPSDIDIVVGSPPCTQFSYSNRGGSGDVYDGLKDIYKFLEIVEHVNPKYWVMENVPRVATFMRRELGLGGALERFRSLVEVIEVVDCASFGLPQKRKRMLAGKFPFRLLSSYASIAEQLTLGQIMDSIAGDNPKDLVYKKSIRADRITDNHQESPLTPEEMRINRDSKQYNCIYNKMQFPEPLDSPARTITATETRVSRESLIVLDSIDESYRRLTNRERASIQSFPLTYQFYSTSHSARLKMIGNAIPPLLTYYIARSIQGVLPADMPSMKELEYVHHTPEKLPDCKSPDNYPRKYPTNRRFRAAIPNLRFGSGVRFDLSNAFEDDSVKWQITFSFGPSKAYSVITPNQDFMKTSEIALADDVLYNSILKTLEATSTYMDKSSIQSLQSVWNHQKDQGMSPHDLIDNLGQGVLDIKNTLGKHSSFDAFKFVKRYIGNQKHADAKTLSDTKLNQIALDICAGLFVSSWFNSRIS